MKELLGSSECKTILPKMFLWFLFWTESLSLLLMHFLCLREWWKLYKTKSNKEEEIGNWDYFWIQYRSAVGICWSVLFWYFRGVLVEGYSYPHSKQRACYNITLISCLFGKLNSYQWSFRKPKYSFGFGWT